MTKHDYRRIVTDAQQAVEAIADPELKRDAFLKLLERFGASQPPARLETISKLVQVLSVIAGVAFSFVSYRNAVERDVQARVAEAEARKGEVAKYEHQRQDERERQMVEAEKRRMEAARPFLEIRQQRYLEVVAVTATLSNPTTHTKAELDKARTRFRDLYVAELSLVEAGDVEKAMVAFAKKASESTGVEPFTNAQEAAYQLAHALRDSLAKSWNVDTNVINAAP